MSQKFYIEAQTRMERAAANDCDIFTTVSEITGKECEFLLGRKPDMILPNGISLPRFLATHELQNLHGQFRTKIDEFVMSHFFILILLIWIKQCIFLLREDMNITIKDMILH